MCLLASKETLSIGSGSGILERLRQENKIVFPHRLAQCLCRNQDIWFKFGGNLLKMLLIAN
jgi:hypothetical protein